MTLIRLIVAIALAGGLWPIDAKAQVLALAELYADRMAGSAPPPPETAFSQAQKGYDAYASGDFQAAAAAFQRSLALNLEQPVLAAQLGYTYKELGRSRDAAKSFRDSITRTKGEADYHLRREVEVLENRFDATAYVIWRENALDGPALAAAGPSLTQSQGGAELAWTPPRIGYRKGRKLQLFGRFLWGFEGDTFNVQDESYQAGFGLRYRPLTEHNLVLTAERLVGVGDYARDNWMLRASYSWDRGYAYQPKETSWDYLTFYADAAVIDPADPDLFLLAEGRYGRSFRIAGGGTGPGWVLTPHATASTVLQHDSFNTTTLVEAGAGASLKLWFADTAYVAHAASAELLVQWRGKIAGDSAGPSGFIATLVFLY